ncbi:MAG: ImmA/IrrE family metallo-endopeptidase [bacterium]
MDKLNIDYKKIEKIANDVLALMYASKPPINSDDAASENGLSVYRVDMPPQFEEVAGYLDIDNKEIVVNAGDPPWKRNYTVAHELGHYLLHKENIKSNLGIYKVLFRMDNRNEKNKFEIEADTFARYLLFPKYLRNSYKGYQPNLLSKIFLIPEKLVWKTVGRNGS